jgi:hypothetical protein
VEFIWVHFHGQQILTRACPKVKFQFFHSFWSRSWVWGLLGFPNWRGERRIFQLMNQSHVGKSTIRKTYKCGFIVEASHQGLGW